MTPLNDVYTKWLSTKCPLVKRLTTNGRFYQTTANQMSVSQMTGWQMTCIQNDYIMVYQMSVSQTAGS